jgi:hypothetical protein
VPHLAVTPPAGLCTMTWPAATGEATYVIREPRPAAVSLLCATVCPSLKTLGTMTPFASDVVLAFLTETRSVIADPFWTFVPAAGLSWMTTPAAADAGTVFTRDLNPAARSFARAESCF